MLLVQFSHLDDAFYQVSTFFDVCYPLKRSDRFNMLSLVKWRVKIYRHGFIGVLAKPHYR
jgi:hypothetical protein